MPSLLTKEEERDPRKQQVGMRRSDRGGGYRCVSGEGRETSYVEDSAIEGGGRTAPHFFGTEPTNPSIRGKHASYRCHQREGEKKEERRGGALASEEFHRSKKGSMKSHLLQSRSSSREKSIRCCSR